MRNVLKSLSPSIWTGIALTLGGIVAYNIGSYLDNGNIDRLAAAHQPIYMNTLPEMALMLGIAVTALGLLQLFAALGERLGAPIAGDALGIFLNAPIKR